MPTGQSSPMGKFYRDSRKMRNLRATFAKTRSHAVRMTILKEMYAECQRLAHRGRTRAKAVAIALRRGGAAAQRGSSWTFRKVGNGARRGGKYIREGVPRSQMAQSLANRHAARRQVAQAQRGQAAQAQAARRKAAESQRTPKLTRLVNPAPAGPAPVSRKAPAKAPARQGAKAAVPLPSEIKPPARARKTGGPAPANPAGVARKPRARKRS